MRGLIDDLTTASPFGELLPAVYQEDPFAMRFVAGFDDVLAPILTTLDCITDYFDAELTPVDFLEWLAGWVGIELDERWPIERRRAAVVTAAATYRMRGTVVGLRTQLEMLTGGDVEITDSGGVAWSSAPMAEPPGEDQPRLAVRVIVAAEPSEQLLNAVDAVVAAARPAHVVYRVEVAAL